MDVLLWIGIAVGGGLIVYGVYAFAVFINSRSEDAYGYTPISIPNMLVAWIPMIFAILAIQSEKMDNQIVLAIIALFFIAGLFIRIWLKSSLFIAIPSIIYVFFASATVALLLLAVIGKIFSVVKGDK